MGKFGGNTIPLIPIVRCRSQRLYIAEGAQISDLIVIVTACTHPKTSQKEMREVKSTVVSTEY